MTFGWGNVHFRSSKHFPRLSLGLFRDFLSWHSSRQGLSLKVDLCNASRTTEKQGKVCSCSPPLTAPRLWIEQMSKQTAVSRADCRPTVISTVKPNGINYAILTFLQAVFPLTCTLQLKTFTDKFTFILESMFNTWDWFLLLYSGGSLYSCHTHSF